MEETKAPRAGRLYQLDYLKAAAIVLVILTHNNFTAQDRLHPVFLYLINMAVPLFMLVYGYVRAMACARRGACRTPGGAVRDWVRKLWDVLAPYLIAFCLELLIFALRENPAPVQDIPRMLLTGGYGPGSYYVPMLLQLLVLFPLLQRCFSRWPRATLLGTAVFDVLYELAAQRWIPDGVYRLLCFRCIVFVAAGMALFRYRDRLTGKLLAALAAISIAFLHYISFINAAPPLFARWTTTASPVVFWVAALTTLVIRHAPKLPGLLHRLVQEVGQSTYYIYLVQMVWYATGCYPKTIGMLGSIVTSLFCTVCFGVVFHWGERWLYRRTLGRRLPATAHP